MVYEFAQHDFLAQHPDAVELVTFGELVPVYGFILATRDAVDDPARGAALEDFVARLGRAYQWAAANRDQWVEQFYVENLGLTPEGARAIADAVGTPQLVEITDAIRDDQQDQADLLLAVDELPDEVDVGDQFPPEVTERFNAAVADVVANQSPTTTTSITPSTTTSTPTEETAP